MKSPKFIQKKALGFMQGLVEKVGYEIHTMLSTLVNDMNISVDRILKDYKDDYNGFMNYVNDTYKDYKKGGKD